ncbi:MAG: hypothetical protein ACAH83_16295 [Alphaproteobacteria bacterium]
MHKLFSIFKPSPDPGLSQLSDAEFADWAKGAKRRGNIRTAVTLTLGVAGILGSMGAWLMGLVALFGMTGIVGFVGAGIGELSALGGFVYLLHRFKPWQEEEVLEAETARRSALSAGHAAAPMLSANAAEAFSAAAHNGVEGKMTVKGPLKLVKKAPANMI